VITRTWLRRRKQMKQQRGHLKDPSQLDADPSDDADNFPASSATRPSTPSTLLIAHGFGQLVVRLRRGQLLPAHALNPSLRAACSQPRSTVRLALPRAVPESRRSACAAGGGQAGRSWCYGSLGSSGPSLRSCSREEPLRGHRRGRHGQHSPTPGTSQWPLCPQEPGRLWLALMSAVAGSHLCPGSFGLTFTMTDPRTGSVSNKNHQTGSSRNKNTACQHSVRCVVACLIQVMMRPQFGASGRAASEHSYAFVSKVCQHLMCVCKCSPALQCLKSQDCHNAVPCRAGERGPIHEPANLELCACSCACPSGSAASLGLASKMVAPVQNVRGLKKIGHAASTTRCHTHHGGTPRRTK